MESSPDYWRRMDFWSQTVQAGCWIRRDVICEREKTLKNVRFVLVWIFLRLDSLVSSKLLTIFLMKYLSQKCSVQNQSTTIGSRKPIWTSGKLIESSLRDYWTWWNFDKTRPVKAQQIHMQPLISLFLLIFRYKVGFMSYSKKNHVQKKLVSETISENIVGAKSEINSIFSSVVWH